MTDKIYNGGHAFLIPENAEPAFPVTVGPTADGSTTVYFGIAARDWFARQAISGNRLNCATPKELAEFGYMVADAMIAERSKKREG